MKSRTFLVVSVLTERQPGAGRLLVNSRPFAGDRVQLRRQKYELSFPSRLAAKGSRLQYSPTSAHRVSYMCLGEWMWPFHLACAYGPVWEASKQASDCMSLRCRSQEEDSAVRMRDEQEPL